MNAKHNNAYLVNPLPNTLHHYEGALRGLLDEAGLLPIRQSCPTVEVGGSAQGRAKIAVRSAWSRLMILRKPKGVVIALWPALGLLEPLLYLPASLRHDVLLIVHDPIPIRPQFGYSRAAKFVARACLAISPRLRLVTHTMIAQQDLLDSAGCESIRLPHPLAEVETPVDFTVSPEKPTVRVLGQYKPSRDLGPLNRLGRELAGAAHLEILGRGWPAVEGWTVVDEFLDESEFNTRIRTASCVVIPYARFYQSGVASRCAELAIPVVGPVHEHLEELFGQEWPGLVLDECDWSRAVTAAIGTDRGELADTISARREMLHERWTLQLTKILGS